MGYCALDEDGNSYKTVEKDALKFRYEMACVDGAKKPLHMGECGNCEDVCPKPPKGKRGKMMKMMKKKLKKSFENKCFTDGGSYTSVCELAKARCKANIEGTKIPEITDCEE